MIFRTQKTASGGVSYYVAVCKDGRRRYSVDGKEWFASPSRLNNLKRWGAPGPGVGRRFRSKSTGLSSSESSGPAAGS